MFKRTVVQREIWPFLSLALAFLSSSCVTEPVDYTLRVTVVGDGAVVSSRSGINASGPGSYNSVFTEGMVVTLTASPAAGSKLKAWGGACSGTGASCTITMSSNQTVSVEFEQVLYALTVTVVGDGTVVSSPSGINASGPGSYNSVFGEGTVVTLTASPAAGSSLKAWGGACTGEAAICTITMSSEQTTSVEFVENAVLIVVLDGGVVSSLQEGTTTVKTGEEIAYSFSTESGWTDLAVWINGVTSPDSGAVEARDTVAFLALALPEQPLPEEDSVLADERRALAQATSAEAFLLAAEEYLRKLESAGALDSPEQLDRIRAETFDPKSGYEQAVRLNGLLRGSRIFFRDGQLVGLGNSGVPGPAPPFGSTDTWVPVFINGIFNGETGALESSATLAKILKEGGFGGGMEFWYNPNITDDRQAFTVKGCLLSLDRDWTAKAKVSKFLDCVNVFEIFEEFDPVEALLQTVEVSTGMNGSPSNDDARDFDALLQASMSRGSHLQFVAHSQGNLVLQEALGLTQGAGGNLPLCFGVTGIAEPVSGQARWPLTTGRYQSIVAEGDAILALGRNNSPTIETQLSGERSKDLDALELNWLDLVFLNRAITKSIAQLIVRAYYGIRIHTISAYFADSNAKQAIVAAVADNAQAVGARAECSSPDVENVITIGDGTPGADFDTDGGSFSLAVAPVDPQGKLQTGLTVNNFNFENVRAVSLTGRPNVSGNATATEVIAEARTDDAIDLMMVFDASGSMGTSDPNKRSLAAGQELITRLRPNDRVGVMRFSSTVTLLQALTTDRQAANDAIAGITFGGGTALYQAVIDGSNLLAGKSVPTLLVLSDGGNNRSPSNRSQAVAAAMNIGASVYGIGLGSGSAVENIRALAVETGGVYANASDAGGLEQVYDAIAVGVGQGRLVIKGEGVFDRTLSTGLYRVEGDLITRIGARRFATRWKFEVDIR